MSAPEITIDELRRRCAPGYPLGPFRASGAQSLSDAAWRDAVFAAARSEGLCVSVCTGLEVVRGGVFFGVRLRGLELGLLRPEGPSRIYVSIEECPDAARLTAWRCDLSGDNASTDEKVARLMRAIARTAGARSAASA